MKVKQRAPSEGRLQLSCLAPAKVTWSTRNLVAGASHGIRTTYGATVRTRASLRMVKRSRQVVAVGGGSGLFRVGEAQLGGGGRAADFLEPGDDLLGRRHLGGDGLDLVPVVKDLALDRVVGGLVELEEVGVLDDDVIGQVAVSGPDSRFFLRARAAGWRLRAGRTPPAGRGRAAGHRDRPPAPWRRRPWRRGG